MLYHLKMLIVLIGISFSLPFCSQLTNALSQIRSDNSLPSWIVSIDSSLSKTNLVYIIIDNSKIWEPGDDVISLGIQISESLKIKIDGTNVPSDKIFTLDTFGPPTYVYDQDNNIVGSYRNLGNIYFEVAVPIGVHTATIEVTSSSDKLFTYSWEFEVTQILPTQPTVN